MDKPAVDLAVDGSGIGAVRWQRTFKPENLDHAFSDEAGRSLCGSKEFLSGGGSQRLPQVGFVCPRCSAAMTQRAPGGVVEDLPLEVLSGLNIRA